MNVLKPGGGQIWRDAKDIWVLGQIIGMGLAGRTKKQDKTKEPEGWNSNYACMKISINKKNPCHPPPLPCSSRYILSAY
jgi:hypothetical protein